MTDPAAQIRDAVRAPCAESPDEHHREVDEQRGGREAFVPATSTSTSGIAGNACTGGPA